MHCPSCSAPGRDSIPVAPTSHGTLCRCTICGVLRVERYRVFARLPEATPAVRWAPVLAEA